VAKDKAPKKRLHLLFNPYDPDVVLVLANDSVPGTIPVIPTQAVTSYWVHS
jgi:hypothetical protein